MDFILNPIFILLVIFGGFCSLAVLTFIKWRHQRAGITVATTSVLHHDLTKGRFGPFWSSLLAMGKVVGVLIWVIYFGSVLLDHSGDHRSKYGEEAQAQLARLRGGGPEPTAAPKNASDDSMFMDHLKKELAGRVQEVASQSASTARQAGLRRSRKEFLSFYGEPLATSASSAPPASAAAGFEHGDLALIVSFWKEAAHEIDVCRKDGKQLTAQDVQWGLGSFTDGDKWRVAAKSAEGQATSWKQDGANASLFTGEDDKGTVYLLRISTDEFSVERDKLDGQ